MPNWVQSRLTVKGKDAEKVLSKYMLNEKSDISNYTFDFNKIKKMPKELLIENSTTTNDCIKVYLSSLPLNDYFDKAKMLANAELFPQITATNYLRLGEKETNELVKRCIDFNSKGTSSNNSPIFKTKEDVIAYGKKAVDNVKKYKAKDWYDWSIKNWGTKWDACYTSYDESCPNEVMFQTAWSDVRPLIIELSKKHPENSFFYEYSEEEVGNYVGKCLIKNGKFEIDTELDDYSKEAFELAFDLWGEDENYVYNEKIGTYVYKDDNIDDMSGEM